MTSIDRDEKKIQTASHYTVGQLHSTLKQACDNIISSEYISGRLLAELELAVELLKDKLEIQTYDIKTELLKGVKI